MSLYSAKRGLVVKVVDSWPAGHEFEPSSAEDPPCRGVMHVASVESSNALPLVWRGITRGLSRNSELRSSDEDDLSNVTLLSELRNCENGRSLSFYRFKGYRSPLQDSSSVEPGHEPLIV
ncbi:hypothetical protein TNCV_2480591 [Trichonephila clavipes]|nr:hypothetical protein TNCV_2480591 [Trichonephila clavipes]